MIEDKVLKIIKGIFAGAGIVFLSVLDLSGVTAGGLFVFFVICSLFIGSIFIAGGSL